MKRVVAWLLILGAAAALSDEVTSGSVALECIMLSAAFIVANALHPTLSILAACALVTLVSFVLPVGFVLVMVPYGETVSDRLLGLIAHLTPSDLINTFAPIVASAALIIGLKRYRKSVPT